MLDLASIERTLSDRINNHFTDTVAASEAGKFPEDSVKQKMEYPQSPFGVLSHMVQQYEDELVTPEAFLAGLDNFERYLQGWFQQVSQMPEHPDFEAGRILKASTLESIQLFADALIPLREYAESGEAELLEEGSQLANEGHELMIEAMNGTRKTIDQLENDLENRD